MEDLINKLGWKKVGFILILACIAGFIYIVFSFLSLVNPKQSGKVANNPLPPVVSGTIFRSSRIPKNSNLWVEKKVDNVKITYPPSWNDSYSPVEGGGFVSSIQPVDHAPNDSFPRVDIMEIPFRSKEQVPNLISQLEGVGFVKSEVSYQNQKVVKLSRTLPGVAFSQGDPEHKDVIKDAFIFQKGNFVYEVDYSYYDDNNRQNVEDEVSYIMNKLEIE